jgi:transporter family protein
MWLGLAGLSAVLLGCYEVCKKISLRGNAVLPILHFNTCVGGLALLPLLGLSMKGYLAESALFYVAPLSGEEHGAVVLKSVLVLVSWGTGYAAVKNLPLTLTGPVKASQPVITVVGAVIIFGEYLNMMQWAGVGMAILSFHLLAATGRKEGVSFGRNGYIWLMLASIFTGALSGLYDRYLLRSIPPLSLQVWFTIYQAVLLTPVHLFFHIKRRERRERITWRWQIPLVSILLLAADYFYFVALSDPDALISVISMVRRSNVIITFLFGAYYFHERNLRAKAFDLFLILLAMIILYFGSR